MERSYNTSFTSDHTFAEGHPLVIKEVIYISETCTESHWKVDDVRNKGMFPTWRPFEIGTLIENLFVGKCMVLGSIVVDLSTFLIPRRVFLETHNNGKMYYKVTVLVKMTVIDRDLRVTIHWPPHEDGQTLEGKSFTMVAGFEPGTL
jgi:hypothetical protein